MTSAIGKVDNQPSTVVEQNTVIETGEPSPASAKLGFVNSMLGWVHTKVITPIRNSAFVKSRAVQITFMVLGIILIVTGLSLLFLFHEQLGNNSFLFIIPAILGLVKLLITSVCLGEECSLDKWRVFRKWAGLLEDHLDNGALDGSNKFFVDEHRDERRTTNPEKS
ncbi:cysteine-rich outer membrane protein [Chlamydia sp. 17-3921]|uniref:cysteine-rich outer membrane protein n=1 Tax=Chlamydia sp. 17-3921 TaxID=2675798 RepID=UPI00191B5B2D|nr:cysteine-rich outer membrane protein [Chlamydia sp. 17-3921]